MASNLIEPTYLLDYPLTPSVNDYRCVVDGSGLSVIFERSLPHSKADNLYSLDLVEDGGAQPVLLMQKASPPPQSNRPDWQWHTGSVAFNWIDQHGRLSVGIVDVWGNVRRLNHTGHMNYPTWYPGGGHLAVMNRDKAANPNPSTSKIDAEGKLVSSALAGSQMWTGMPSVNQASPNLIAFAGQPANTDPTQDPYNEDQNYIYTVDTSKTPLAPAVLEYGAAGTYFEAKFQGRAPWWSPDGKWVVFESNRACPPPANSGKGMYAIFLYKAGSTNSAIQVTDPKYNMNHAKWFPGGFPGASGKPTLIVASWQPGANGTPAWPYGIATLDVSSIVKATQ